jgi:poly(3-hydroxybutyrate) depolymerase
MPHSLRSCLRAALVACVAAITAVPAHAGWKSAQESISTHPTWIYTPATRLANGKRGLVVVLHGCAQKNTELKTFGNLAAAAEAAGIVLALPQVRANNQWGPGCWDYDGGGDGHHHVAQVLGLTRTLMTRAALQVDPAQVHVVGLSSGAGLALLLGCVAPDVYAGVGAIAGPSVGSDQEWATTPAIGVLDSNVTNAVDTCRTLAGSKRPFFDTQVANIAYGTMDKDGADALYDPCAWAAIDPWFCSKVTHPGQYRVVSVKWSTDNAEILRRIYGDGAMSASSSVQGGKGSERTAGRNGKAQLSLLEIVQVGHAWPAGTGQANGPGGDWVAQTGLDYPAYIIGWLLRNNLRASRSP